MLDKEIHAIKHMFTLSTLLAELSGISSTLMVFFGTLAGFVGKNLFMTEILESLFL
jgi:hypothetical protein